MTHGLHEVTHEEKGFVSIVSLLIGHTLQNKAHRDVRVFNTYRLVTKSPDAESVTHYPSDSYVLRAYLLDVFFIEFVQI